MNIFFRPENFDILGTIAFLVIIMIAIRGLTKKGSLEKWILWLLLVIGVLGLLIDLSIVYLYLI